MRLSLQLLDEGAVQMLRERSDDGNGNPILAAVGTLQFDGGWVGSHESHIRAAFVVLSIQFVRTPCTWVRSEHRTLNSGEFDQFLYSQFGVGV